MTRAEGGALATSPDSSGALTQGEIAFVHVRDKIMSSGYEPGVRLSEQSIADELNLSRTPAREALRRLSETGLIELVPNHGARVIGWSLEQLRDTFDARVLLEPEGAKRAASRIVPAELEELGDLMDRMEDALEERGGSRTSRIATLNQEFHARIMEVSGQSQVIRLTEILRFQPRMVPVQGAEGDAFRRRANHQHREIHAALEARDGEWAEAAMKTHILAARHASLCAHVKTAVGEAAQA